MKQDFNEEIASIKTDIDCLLSSNDVEVPLGKFKGNSNSSSIVGNIIRMIEKDIFLPL